MAVLATSFTSSTAPVPFSLPAPDLARTAWPGFMSAAAQQDYLSAEAGLDSARSQGYSHWYIDGSLEGERPAEFSAARIAALRAQIQASGMQPLYHGNFKSPLGSDVPALAAAALDYAKQEIDICQQLGGAPLIVHGGGVVEPRLVDAVRAQGLQQLIANLRELVDYATARGVQVWLENLCNYTRFHPFYYICTTAREIAEVLDAVPDLHLFLDVSHAHVNGGDPVDLFRRFHARTAGMSFSDNGGDRDAHLPLGRGNVCFPELVAAIGQTGWRGLIGFETRGGVLADSLRYLHAVQRSPQ